MLLFQKLGGQVYLAHISGFFEPQFKKKNNWGQRIFLKKQQQ